MNLEHAKALSHQGWGCNRRADHNGVTIWSEGHIMGPATVEGATEYAGIPTLWDEIEKREGESLVERGPIYECGRYFYRELKSQSITVIVDEAYLRTVRDDGDALIYAIDKDRAVSIRLNGKLVGLLMPVRTSVEGLTPMDREVSDEEAFRHYANEGNDWYLQGPEELRKRLREAFAE